MRIRTLLSALVVAAAGSVFAHEPTLSRFNYRDHVRPLFLRHCAGCHRASGVAPMSLLEYQETVPWANAIKLALLEGRMPPFLPTDESGPFQNGRALSAVELDTLVDWAVGATPEGEPIVAHEDVQSPGRPAADLLLRGGSDVVLEEGESEKTACIVLPAGLDSTRFVTELEVFPGRSSILRRATILVGDSCSDGEPLATWLPDRTRTSFPEGLGRELSPSSTLALELRYVKGWGEEGNKLTDRSALGLWFRNGAAPVRSVPVSPPLFRLERAARLVALYPSSGDESPLRVEAVAPDGTIRLLLAIDRFDAAWKEKYFFREPITLPAGSALRVSHPGVWADLVPPAASAHP